MKATRLRRLGHVNRMTHGRLQRKMVNSQTVGMKMKSSSRLSWQQDAENDLKRMNVRRWRDRQAWRLIVKEGSCWAVTLEGNLSKDRVDTLHLSFYSSARPHSHICFRLTRLFTNNDFKQLASIQRSTHPSVSN